MQTLKENIRQGILNAAASEFNQNGFENASIRTIAAKAGITPGNIYRYFKNKENILQAVLQPIMDQINLDMIECSNGQICWNANLDELLKNSQTLNIDLKKFSEKFAVLYRENKDGMMLIAKDPVYRDYFKNWLVSILTAYYFGKGKKDPNMVKLMSSVTAVMLIDSIIEGLRVEEESNQGKIDESQIVYQCIAVVMSTEEKLI